MSLAFNQHISVPILRRCSPLPDVLGHPVKDRSRGSESRRHRRRITLVEGVDVVAHCCHRIGHVIEPSTLNEGRGKRRNHSLYAPLMWKEPLAGGAWGKDDNRS